MRTRSACGSRALASSPLPGCAAGRFDGSFSISLNQILTLATVLVLGSGPKDARFKELPPGDSLQFSFSLGDHFKEPGTHRVSWKGTGFYSPEIVFRVLPEKAR